MKKTATAKVQQEARFGVLQLLEFEQQIPCLRPAPSHREVKFKGRNSAPFGFAQGKRDDNY